MTDSEPEEPIDPMLRRPEEDAPPGEAADLPAGEAAVGDVVVGDTDDETPDAASDEQEAAPEREAPSAGTPVQYGVGPLSLREAILVGVWVVTFVLSFLSTFDTGFSSVWTRGIDWILPVGVPTVAVFLLVLRRLSPTGIRRVGSLGIDQFASVAFSVAAVVWLSQLWAQVEVSLGGGRWALSWVTWALFVLALAGVVLTVFAPLVPGLSEDFRHRTAVIAHRNARPVRPVSARPRPVAAVPAQTVAVAGPAVAEAATADPYVVPDVQLPPDGFAPADAVPAGEPTVQVSTPPAQQAFWALVPEERDVVDENGVPVFRIGPTAWALAIEDRGASLVIRHEDGRVGYLNDVSGVTRG